MIDAFYIFTKGGLLLWSTQLVKLKGNPLDRLIKEVLLEERVGETSASLDSYSMKWKLLNELDLFFVVVYQGILQLSYLESLLERTANEFLGHVGGAFGNGMTIKNVSFDADFLKIRQKCDREALEAKKAAKMRSFADTKKGHDVAKNKEEKGLPVKNGKKDGKKTANENEDGDSDGDDEDENVDAKLPAKSKSGSTKKKEVDVADAEKPPQKTKKKEARQWEHGKVDSKSMKALDFSKAKTDDDDDAAFRAKQEEFLGGSGDEAGFMAEDDRSLSSGSDGENDESEDAAGAQDDKPGRVGGLFKNLTRGLKNVTGGAKLTEDELEPILVSFKNALMAKNVAADVSSKLADSVRASLIGRTTERFTSMASTVKSSLQESMETLLTPKKSIDVLRAALAAKNAGRVYTIVFLGVNGVGKSTNLAKVAYYLKNKGGLNLLICACDTFRAGAVEQLKTHARCLDVDLFERGYGKDPAEIAKSAIAHARSNGHDVVLVDTAGRMQDNEPLMRALAKLVAVNNPDLVLFVGEALVGNDAIDQVTKFNKSLIDLSHDPRQPRGIDGMLLTKYDTVDDKVGAALSMVYVTGQPIVFVGTGQKYTHLRKIQAKEVVRQLLG